MNIKNLPYGGNGIICRNNMDTQSQLREENFGMQLNETEAMAVRTSRMIRNVFGDRIDNSGIYDVIDVPNHYILRLVFRAYDYYWVQFNYDNDLCGFSIVLNDEFGVSLENEMRSYMGTKDWDSYLREIMAEIELRIPDEFLKAKGWL